MTPGGGGRGRRGRQSSPFFQVPGPYIFCGGAAAGAPALKEGRGGSLTNYLRYQQNSPSPALNLFF
jgi:hypothetical protein